MKFPDRNAFATNILWGRGFFPFTISCKQHMSGAATMDIHPVALEDIHDIIESYSQDLSFIYDVDQQIIADPKPPHDLLEMAPVIKELGVDCQVYNDRAVGVRKKELGLLLRGLIHYNFHMFDLPSEPSLDQANELYAFATDYDFEEPMLHKVKGSHVFIDSHDDCYLYVESRDMSTLRKIFARTLWIFCGMVILRKSRLLRSRRHFIDSMEIPSSVTEGIFPLDSAITFLIEDATVRRGRLEVSYSRKKYDFLALRRDQDLEIVGTIVCELEGNEWSVMPVE